MKKLEIRSLCFLMVLVLLLNSCQNKENKVDKSEKTYKETIDSAKIVFDQFIALVYNEKYEEALDLYLKEEGSFFVYFDLSTDNFNFHKEIIIPMLFRYKDNYTALKKSIKILEMDLLITETVIGLSDGNNIPSHYGQLLGILEQFYIETGYYEDAISIGTE